MSSPDEDEQAEVPVHEVRAFLAEVTDGEPLVAYHSLDEARTDPDAAVVLSGDYGGTIFLTVPLRHVRCDLDSLRTLVSDLDAVTYMSGDLTIATVAVERHAVGTGVLGGDGGGVVIDGIWTHPRRLPQEIRDQVAEVVQGRRARIDLELLRREREQELARMRASRHAELGSDRSVELHVSAPAIPFD